MEKEYQIEIGEGGILRLRKAANRINLTIYLVGSRASGTHTAYSDFDYVIPGINSKKWKKIKNSLPGAKSFKDNLSNRVDLLKSELDLTKPYLIINPKID